MQFDVSLFVSNSSAECSAVSSYIGACDAGRNRRSAVARCELDSSEQHQWHTHQLFYCLEWERLFLCKLIINQVLLYLKCCVK